MCSVLECSALQGVVCYSVCSALQGIVSSICATVCLTGWRHEAAGTEGA